MTFDEIVDDIMDRLNLTSIDSRDRVERQVNRYYRRVRTSLGIDTYVAKDVATSANTVNGSATVTFPAIQKIYRVYDDTSGSVRVLEQKSWDELRERTPASGNAPTEWAVESYDDASVTVRLNVTMSEVQVLKADGILNVVDLDGDDIPAFPTDFHDILIEGVLADEYRKREKMDLAKISLDEYERRLSDLRMWFAKNAYLTIRQGERSENRLKLYTYRDNG